MTELYDVANDGCMNETQLQKIAEQIVVRPLEWSKPSESEAIGRLHLVSSGVVALPAGAALPPLADPPPPTWYKVEWSISGGHWLSKLLTGCKIGFGPAENLETAVKYCAEHWIHNQSGSVINEWLQNLREHQAREVAYRKASQELATWTAARQIPSVAAYPYTSKPQIFDD